MHAHSLLSPSVARRYVGPISSSVLAHATCGTLHVSGDVSLLDAPSIAVVGARKASPLAVAQAADTAAALARSGYIVLSGLAAGVDAAAHTGALRSGGRTIGVIGTSLDQAYPASSAAMQEKIHRDHLLVSPFGRGTRTAAWHFPARNRVIARLARATVLVEADEPSGTRHVVEECVRERKRVFARRDLLVSLGWLQRAAERGGVIIPWESAADIVGGLVES